LTRRPLSKLRDRLAPVTTLRTQHPRQGLLRALLLQGAAITIAHTSVLHALSRRVRRPTPLPRRPRCVLDADHAGRVLAVADRDRGVLPRWGINSPIRCHPVAPGAYTGTIAWTTRQHYLAVVVPAALRANAEVLNRHHVAPDTLLRWARVKSLYAQEPHNGRQVIVRPDTLAGLLQCSERTVQRCNAAARAIGLELVVIPGRMLSEIETYAARKKGSPQRGLSTVTAFVVPQALRVLVCHVTPTRGRSLHSFVKTDPTFKTDRARSKGAPLRSTPPQRRRGPAWHLAAGLTEQAIFLRRCPPGRIAGQLVRFTRSPHHWTSTQILRAIDQVNVRLGYTAPVRAKTTPWGLLAWYLGQIDEVADAPGFTTAVPRP